LCGRGDIQIHGQVGQERFNLSVAHVFRMALVVKQDEARDPIHIGFFGTEGIMLEAQSITHLVEQFLWVWRHLSPRDFLTRGGFELILFQAYVRPEIEQGLQQICVQS
jgi:hypothetical protein